MHEAQLKGGLPDGVVRPAGVDEVVTLLASHGAAAQVIAGGTDLILELTRRQRPTVEVLIDLTGISGLDRIEWDDEHALIGPLVTHNQLIADPEAWSSALPLAQACREIGSPQLRNRATIVGNVVTASPANDTISALSVLDAELLLRSASATRTVPIADFHRGVRVADLHPDELVVGVRIRRLAGLRSGVFVKAGNRTAQAISVVHAALVLDRRTYPPAVAVALGSVAPTIVRFDHPGLAMDDAAIEAFAESVVDRLEPIDDVRATAAYRRTVTKTMLERGLRSLRDARDTQHTPGPLLSPSGSSHRPARAGTFGPDDDIAATVNDEQVSAPGAHLTLLDWLRDAAGPASHRSLTGTKEGCAEGECGACTVIMNGAAVMSCLIPAASADGAQVVTVEHFAAAGGLDRLQQAFVEHGAVQCGFCIPGFIVAAEALLSEIDQPDTDDVVEALAGNLCRCTGYYKIIDAVVSAGAQA